MRNFSSYECISILLHKHLGGWVGIGVGEGRKDAFMRTKPKAFAAASWIFGGACVAYRVSRKLFEYAFLAKQWR